MDLSGLFDTVSENAGSLIDAATQAQIAKINARSLRPAAPAPVYVQTAPALTTSDKAAALARSPALWVSVALLLVVGGVLIFRR